MMGDSERAILAIDTSGVDLRLGVAFGTDRLVKSREPVEKSHGRFIIKKISDLLSSGGLSPAQLTALVVCTGPGSFTGLRVGLAVAKGMAVGLNVPVVGVSLFEIAAYKLAGDDGPVRIVVPYRQNEFFVATVAAGTFKTGEIMIMTAAGLASLNKNIRVAAMGGSLANQIPDLKAADMSESLTYDASELLHLGRLKLSHGQAADLTSLEPLYLSRSQAEIRFAQRDREE